MQVKDTSPCSFPDRPAHALAQVAAEKVEALATVREIDESRLLRMQLEPETCEHMTHTPSRFLDVRLRVTHHHEVIGIADQRA
jgi:hypothetical protein